MSKETISNINEEKVEEMGTELVASETKEQNEDIEEVDLKEQLKEEVFENLKNSLLNNRNLLERFLEFSREHSSMEFEEVTTLEESEEALRKADKIRDKLLSQIEMEHFYIFENVETNTLCDMIVFHADAKEHQYKVVLEVLDEGFNLEVI